MHRGIDDNNSSISVLVRKRRRIARIKIPIVPCAGIASVLAAKRAAVSSVNRMLKGDAEQSINASRSPLCKLYNGVNASIVGDELGTILRRRIAFEV